jgi:hypothetical protein
MDVNYNGYFKLSNVEFCKLFRVNFDEICKLNFPGNFARFSSIALNDLIQLKDDGIIIESNELLEAGKRA